MDFLDNVWPCPAIAKMHACVCSISCGQQLCYRKKSNGSIFVSSAVPEARGFTHSVVDEEAILPQFSDHFKEFVDSKQIDTEDVISQAFSPVNLRSFERISLQDDDQLPPFEVPVEKVSYAAIVSILKSCHIIKVVKELCFLCDC